MHDIGLTPGTVAAAAEAVAKRFPGARILNIGSDSSGRCDMELLRGGTVQKAFFARGVIMDCAEYREHADRARGQDP